MPDRGWACKWSAWFSLFLCCGILVSLCEAADIGWSCEDLHSAWECFSLLQHKSDPLQPLAPYTPAQSQSSKTPSVRPQGKSDLLAQPTRPPQAAQLGQSCFLLFPHLAYAGSHLSGFFHMFPPPWMPSALTPLTVFFSFQIPYQGSLPPWTLPAHPGRVDSSFLWFPQAWLSPLSLKDIFLFHQTPCAQGQTQNIYSIKMKKGRSKNIHILYPWIALAFEP